MQVREHRRRRCALGCRAIALVAALWTPWGCGGAAPPPPGVVPPDELVKPGATVDATLSGRPFRLTPLSAEIRGTETYSLEIVGDGLMVSFTAQAPPHTPSVTGNTVEFGAHRFEVTATPAAFVVDGTAVKLRVGGLHYFNEGIYHGELNRL